jgi:hypothetical protein
MGSEGTDNRSASRFGPRPKKAALIALSFLVPALFVLRLLLPGWLERTIRAEAGKAGIDDLRCRVISIGLGGLELADISVGEPAKSALRIERLSIGYSLAGFFKQRVKEIRVLGLAARASIDGHGVHVSGIRFAVPEGANRRLDIPFDRLFLIKSQILLDWEKRRFEIPIRCALERAAGKPEFDLKVWLKPRDMPAAIVEGKVSLDPLAGQVVFSSIVNVGNYLRKTGFLPEWRAAGELDARGKINFRESGLREAAISLHSRGVVQLAWGKLADASLDSVIFSSHIVPPFSPRDLLLQISGRRLRYETTSIDSPFRILVQGRDLERVDFHLQGAPPPDWLPISAVTMKGAVSAPLTEPSAEGEFRLLGARRISLPGQPELVMKEPLVITGKFSIRRNSGIPTYTARLNADQSLAVHRGPQTISGHLQLNGFLQGTSERHRGSVRCRMEPIALEWSSNHIRARSGCAEFNFELRPDGVLRSQGRLQISGGSFSGSSSVSPQATGLELELPWRWPAGQAAPAGRFSAAGLQAGETRLQSIRGAIVQNPSSVDFSGTARTGLAPFQLAFNGSASLQPPLDQLRLRADLQPVTLAPATPLGPLHRLLKGISVGGSIRAGGTLFIRNETWDGTACLGLDGVELQDEAAGATLSGLETEVELLGLNDPHSAPDQRLRFAELKIGGLSLSGGDIRFALERGGVLALGTSRVAWCGGSVQLDPLRIVPGQEEVSLALICDKINFARMLNMMWGKEVASGDAELSGTIPLQLRQGTPRFQNGRLHSQPGGGHLAIIHPELISGGQVLVEEAIRDFRYETIEVTLNSPGDRLDMIISMAGAPTRKLPLVYDPGQKDLVRDKHGRRQVTLKGLRLDVRLLDVDLRRLLQAGEKLASVGSNEKR